MVKADEIKKGFFLPYRSANYPESIDPVKNPKNTKEVYKLFISSFTLHSCLKSI